jgi:hypothetical protein
VATATEELMAFPAYVSDKNLLTNHYYAPFKKIFFFLKPARSTF